MSIIVENYKDPVRAMKVIEKDIANIKVKIECLQLHALTLLKQKDEELLIIITEKLNKTVREIVGALIEFK